MEEQASAKSQIIFIALLKYEWKLTDVVQNLYVIFIYNLHL